MIEESQDYGMEGAASPLIAKTRHVMTKIAEPHP